MLPLRPQPSTHFFHFRELISYCLSSQNGITPSYIAAQNGHIEVLTLLGLLRDTGLGIGGHHNYFPLKAHGRA